jgi:hypothetical protein
MKGFQAARKNNNYDKLSKMSGQDNTFIDEIKRKYKQARGFDHSEIFQSMLAGLPWHFEEAGTCHGMSPLRSIAWFFRLKDHI